MGDLKEMARAPDHSIVEMLEDALADAKSGKLIGLVMLTNDAGGYRRWATGHWTKQDALFLFEHWKHEVLFNDR